jgi:phage baseplate assembly protein W
MATTTTPRYKGFSTYEYMRSKSFTLTDIELVKMDLLNHIYTRRGERVMMPRFGTRIPDLAFEPLDPFLLDIIQEDLLQVINFDPRVELLDLVLNPLYDENTLTASIRLLFVEIGVQDTLNLNIVFESQ